MWQEFKHGKGSQEWRLDQEHAEKPYKRRNQRRPEQWTRVLKISETNLDHIPLFNVQDDIAMQEQDDSEDLEDDGGPWEPLFFPKNFNRQGRDWLTNEFKIS